MTSQVTTGAIRFAARSRDRVSRGTDWAGAVYLNGSILGAPKRTSSGSLMRSSNSLAWRSSVQEPVVFLSFGFRMHTETGVLVTEASTPHHGFHIPSFASETGYLDRENEALNLSAAKYTISRWITDQAGEVGYDNIENAMTLDVDAAKPYGSNFIIDGRFGIVFFPQKWNLAGMPRQTEDFLNGLRNFKES